MDLLLLIVVVSAISITMSLWACDEDSAEEATVFEVAQRSSGQGRER